MKSERLVAIHLLVGVEFIYVDHVPGLVWRDGHDRIRVRAPKPCWLPWPGGVLHFLSLLRAHATSHAPCPQFDPHRLGAARASTQRAY
jgi:hypothetical protein